MYRYRRLESFLDFEELEKQSIYFASPSELNDPIEGTMDVVWKGDSIVWKNFLSHYLLCLERMSFLSLLCDDAKDFGATTVPVHISVENLPTSNYANMFLSMKTRFFSSNVVLQLLHNLSFQERPIRKNELHLSLMLLQSTALQCIFSEYISHELHPDTGIIDFLKRIDNMKVYSAVYNDMIHTYKDEVIDSIFTTFKKKWEENKLWTYIRRESEDTESKLNTLLFDFPDRYLDRIMELVYPKWYAACFSTTCSDARMWAQYAGDHNGVCLKFRVIERDGEKFLPLYRETGYSSNGAIFNWVDSNLVEVKYIDEIEMLDFFRSMLVLPEPTLMKEWYTDSESGQRSVCADAIVHINDNDGTVRGEYWKKFRHITSSKSADWRNEQEFRLIIDSPLHDYTDTHDRVVKYRFENLEAIIFGSKVANKDKKRIFRIAQKKCEETNCYDIEFYQAGFDRKTKKMFVDKLDLLKCNANAGCDNV